MAKSSFVKILEHRIRKTNIKKYLPVGDFCINIHFSISAKEINMYAYRYDSAEERNEALSELDYQFFHND